VGSLEHTWESKLGAIRSVSDPSRRMAAAARIDRRANSWDERLSTRRSPYIGWTVVFSQDAAGTPCSAVRSPSWTALVFVYSASTGDTPEDAPITPGAFEITNPAGPPHAGVQIEGGVAGRGQVAITAFDDDHIEGTFSGSGETTTLPPELFGISGSFDAKRCDF